MWGLSFSSLLNALNTVQLLSYWWLDLGPRLETQWTKSFGEALFERRCRDPLLFIRYYFGTLPVESRSDYPYQRINCLVFSLFEGIWVSISNKVKCRNWFALTFVSLISKLAYPLDWLPLLADHGTSQGSPLCRRLPSGHCRTQVYLESVIAWCYWVWSIVGAPPLPRICCLATRWSR